MKRKLAIVTLLLMLGVLLAACGAGAGENNPANLNANTEPNTLANDVMDTDVEVPEEPEGPVEETAFIVGSEEPTQIVGGFEYSNTLVTDYYVEHAVALVDMHAFVIRDEEWEIPVASQTLGFLDINQEAMTAEYVVQLPAKPTAQFDDVDHDDQEETGVQVFAVAYWPNLYAGPYSEGDDVSWGWPSYLASVITDTENDDEVIGGKLVVWSPDDMQAFPSGFGEDGLLFTEDDPTLALPAGYTIVDLDQEPFGFAKEAEPELTLYEPQDVAIKDFSEMSWTEAFDEMFAIVSVEYAFNGIEGKQPDWDALYDELYPRIQEAEASGDYEAYVLAMRDFTWAFNDGHVGMGGGSDVLNAYFSQDTEGGYGFSIRDLDDGRVIAVFVLEGGPAAQAGMQVGAEITEFNGMPIGDAIAQTETWTRPTSSDFDLRYQQARYLLTDPLDTESEVTFANPEGQPQTVTLTAVSERDSFAYTSVYRGVDTDFMLPVEFDLIERDNALIGYIRINSNYDDLNLIIRLFERALQTFELYEVEGIIIDMRVNSGGANLGLAGMLYDEEIPMGQLEYYSEATGEFEPEGLPDKVIPNENQYHFDKMVTLVGSTCYSACELEAYGFSQVPGMIVVGMTPSAGVEAEVARGQFVMPDDIFLQIPTGRFVLPDGSIFLEGQGVQPTFPVPVNEETVFAEGDVVLEYGIRAVLQPLSAGITPDHLPTFETDAAAGQSKLESGLELLEDKAREIYGDDDYKTPGTLNYTVTLAQDDEVAWIYGLCTTPDMIEADFEDIELTFEMQGEVIPLEDMILLDYPVSEEMSCKYIYTTLSDWAIGEYHLTTTATFTNPIVIDGTTYPAGDWISEYAVYVNP